MQREDKEIIVVLIAEFIVVLSVKRVINPKRFASTQDLEHF